MDDGCRAHQAAPQPLPSASRGIGSDRHCRGGRSDAAPPALFHRAPWHRRSRVHGRDPCHVQTRHRFENWGRIGDSYVHPFGIFGRGTSEVDLHHYWTRLYRAGANPGPIDDYSMACTMAYMNRFRLPDPDPAKLESTFSYAYQFDANLFAPFLRRVAEQLGARRTEGRIVDVELDAESGDVAAIKMESGERITGDLFVDCSGFVSLLLGKALDEPFEDWSQWLPCDRAVAMPCRTRTALTPYTGVIAMESGWRWRIPLQHRTGNGYVYSPRSSATTTRVRRSFPRSKASRSPSREFSIQGRAPGRSWVGNCVAVGLASGLSRAARIDQHLFDPGCHHVAGRALPQPGDFARRSRRIQPSGRPRIRPHPRLPDPPLSRHERTIRSSGTIADDGGARHAPGKNGAVPAARARREISRGRVPRCELDRRLHRPARHSRRL